MQTNQLESIVQEAINNKQIILITCTRAEDGGISCRHMEPFDIAPFSRSNSGKLMFWGWCLEHNRIEQKHPENIFSAVITSEVFDPSVREKTWKTKSHYRMPRPKDWN